MVQNPSSPPNRRKVVSKAIPVTMPGSAMGKGWRWAPWCLRSTGSGCGGLWSGPVRPDRYPTAQGFAQGEEGGFQVEAGRAAAWPGAQCVCFILNEKRPVFAR